MKAMRGFSLVLGFLCLGGVLPALGVRQGGSSLAPLPKEEWTPAKARHLLLRAGFGGTAEEVMRLYRRGLEGAVSWIVDYEGRPAVVPECGILPMPLVRREVFARMSEEERRKLRNERRREDARRFRVVRSWWVDRMLRSRRPLEEKMTLFWHGHFTSSYRDVRNAWNMLQQNRTLREHATGNFREMLHAITRDPAMLEYLDNNRNRKGRPNENYAREVMELFTLGLGRYTEKDIKEAARAFTGYTFDRRRNVFVFNRRQHDDGMKTIFGKTGRFDGDDVCELLLEHPACAPWVAGKIFAFFGYENPEPDLLRELGETFRACDYEIKPLLRRIFLSRAFYSEKSVGTKVKSPIMLLVSTVKIFGMNPPPGALLVGLAGQLGQELMAPPNVKGWEGGLAWITTANLLARANACDVLLTADLGGGWKERIRRQARGRDRGFFRRAIASWDPGFSAAGLVLQAGGGSPERVLDGLSERILAVPLDRGARARLLRVLREAVGGEGPIEPGRLLHGEAERKLRELLHLLCSAPEFQLC